MTKAHKQILDQFAYHIIKFLSNIHDCHICQYPLSQITGKGRERTLCTKYNLPIKRVRQDCVDRFPGFSREELEDIAEQIKKDQARFAL